MAQTDPFQRLLWKNILNNLSKIWFHNAARFVNSVQMQNGGSNKPSTARESGGALYW